MIPAYRLIFALVTIAAVISQAVSSINLGIFRPANYFSYFTIDSNLMATALLLVGVARWRSRNPPALDILRGAGVVYMSVTGIVFTLLLSGVDVDTQLKWVNTVVHELMPLVILADWLVAPPAMRLTFRQGALWLVFPLDLDHLHADPWCGEQLVSISVPQSGQRRIRERDAVLRRHPGADARRVHCDCLVGQPPAPRW